ncbi:MAG: hypothetical protein HY055_02690, partial [Magnetospirillum sp.]|nr:hypothetical protein [Magnetospirillum sp.]
MTKTKSPKAATKDHSSAIPAEAALAFTQGRKRDALRMLMDFPGVAQRPKTERESAAWGILAAVLLDSAAYDDAEEAAAEALRLSPQDGRIRILHSRILASGNRLSDALLAAGEAVRLVPTDFDAALQLIMVHFEGGTGDKALEEAHAFVSRCGNSPDS